MTVAELNDLNVLDDNNIGRFPPGMVVPAFDNAARKLEGIIARGEQDRNGTIATSGSSTAYTIITNAAYPSLVAGMWFRVRFDEACGTAPTFQVNSLTAKPLKRQTGSAIVPGDITANMVADVIYNAATDTFDVTGIGDASPTVPTYTVALLPTSGPSVAIASNGRKNGEGVGVGTGVFCFRVGTSWYACDTGAIVAA